VRPLGCVDCARTYPVESLAWRCGCGGLLDVADFTPVLDPARLAGLPSTAASLWRYREVLPLRVDLAVSMGEGLTPLVPAARWPGVRLKLDFLMPTLSFKDRGAVLLATLARRLRVERAVVDSSGNAGTAAAAYLARARVACEVFVPEATSPGKLAQMRVHGATVRLVPGSRADTAEAARAAADTPGTFYASHVYHPYFVHGVKTYAYELWEQSGHRLPGTVVVPVGNGTLVLGCYLAFRELLATGLVDRMPAIVAVQAAACAPLAAAHAAGRDAPVPTSPSPTIAEGIAIAAPPRGRQILQAVRATGGSIVSVTDDQTAAARDDLAVAGLFVEPTAAVCWAAVRAAHGVGPDPPDNSLSSAAQLLLTADDVVVPLCGAGLKSPGVSPLIKAQTSFVEIH
jgi:threonine synthase